MEAHKINKPRAWNRKKLTGDWQVTVKLDGIRAIWHDEQGWLSRANKPLYNIPPWQQGIARDCELFVGSFRDTIRATRTKFPNSETPPIQLTRLYGLDPLERDCTGARSLTLAPPTSAPNSNAPIALASKDWSFVKMSAGLRSSQKRPTT